MDKGKALEAWMVPRFLERSAISFFYRSTDEVLEVFIRLLFGLVVSDGYGSVFLFLFSDDEDVVDVRLLSISNFFIESII